MARARSVAALALALVLLNVPVAGAHPMPTSAVVLDIGSGKVGGEIVLPLDRLAVALNRPLAPAEAVGPLRARLDREATGPAMIIQRNRWLGWRVVPRAAVVRARRARCAR